MILAEKIILLRKKNGWSQEELAQQLAVSRQSVSKWEGGQSIPDLDKLLALSAVFGVTVDYLVKEELGENSIEYTEDGAELQETLPRITVEEANRFLEEYARAARQIALGVSLCILSPIMLIFLCMAAETGFWALSEDMGAGIGTGILLLLVACAIPLFIKNGIALEKYEYIEKEDFISEYGVEGIVRDRKEKFAPVFSGGITFGVTLIILGVIPLLLAGGFGASDMIYTLFTCFLLVLIAVAVNRIVRVGIIQGSYQRLLQEGDYTKKKKSLNRRYSAVGTVYWCVVTSVYLAVSFKGSLFGGGWGWDKSWIIWPIAGILYAALYGFLRILQKDG